MNANGIDGTTGVYARYYDRIESAIEIGMASGRVIRVTFPESPSSDAVTEHSLLDRIKSYLSGEFDEFEDVHVALTLPSEQRRVLEGVEKVPYGETASVSQIVRLAGLNPDEPDDISTVTESLRENPTPIFIPDHRVLTTTTTPDDVADILRSIEES